MKHTYFDYIDSPIKAYMLGFICADGHLNKNGRSLEIKIQERDEEIVNKFAQELDVHTVYRGSSSAGYRFIRLNVNSTYLMSKLSELGLTNNKTFNLKMPNIEERFYNSFVLGLFDGDGNLYMGNNAMTSFSVASGSKLLLKAVYNIITDSKRKRVFIIKPQDNIYILRGDRINDVVEVMADLYGSVDFCLSRKYAIYNKMVDKYASINLSRLCEISGCANKYYAKGKCKSHYYKTKTIKSIV